MKYFKKAFLIISICIIFFISSSVKATVAIPGYILADMNKISAKYNIPTWFLAGLIEQESSFNPQDKNKSSNAYGLMQIMPSNWTYYAPKLGYNIETDKDNIYAQLDVGTYLLKNYIGNNVNWDSDWQSDTLPGLTKYGGFATAKGYSSIQERAKVEYASKIWNFANNYQTAMVTDSSSNYDPNNINPNMHYVFTPSFEIIDCSDLLGQEIIDWIKGAYFFVVVGAIILVIILTMLDFSNVVMSQDEESKTKAFKNVKTRFIILAIIILLPPIINYLLGLIEIPGINHANPFCE